MKQYIVEFEYCNFDESSSQRLSFTSKQKALNQFYSFCEFIDEIYPPDEVDVEEKIAEDDIYGFRTTYGTWARATFTTMQKPENRWSQNFGNQ